jgi:hypothetical protein
MRAVLRAAAALPRRPAARSLRRSAAPRGAMAQQPARIVIVPGNGMEGSLEDLRAANFYGWAEREFTARGHDVRMQPMPDPLYAKERVWVPFITDTLGADDTAVLIGHSSGAGALLHAGACR